MRDFNYSELNFSPIHSLSHAAIQFPIRMKLFANHLAGVPRSAGSDGVISYGGGTGTGWAPLKKAYGEFLERNHFFTAVPCSSVKPLKDLHPEELRQKLLRYCQEVQLEKTDCLEHKFHFAPVYNLFDHQKYEFFYNSIGLNGFGADSHFIPFNDSCACASHGTKEQALLGSLTEFLERQALLGSWTSKKIRYTINPELLFELVPYHQLLEYLLDNGELYVFENGVDLPGHSVIMFYFSNSAKDIVQYSVGSSAGLTFEKAIQSALEELWQCYTFQYNAENSQSLEDKAGASYHLNFQKCNTLSVKEIIPFLENYSNRSWDVIQKSDLKLLIPVSFSEAVDKLSQISRHIYYYHHYDGLLGVHYSKIVSPDFFMHMALDKPINIGNSYAKKLGVTEKNAYKVRIPFP